MSMNRNRSRMIITQPNFQYRDNHFTVFPFIRALLMKETFVGIFRSILSYAVLSDLKQPIPKAIRYF